VVWSQEGLNGVRSLEGLKGRVSAWTKGDTGNRVRGEVREKSFYIKQDACTF